MSPQAEEDYQALRQAVHTLNGVMRIVNGERVLGDHQYVTMAAENIRSTVADLCRLAERVKTCGRAIGE